MSARPTTSSHTVLGRSDEPEGEDGSSSCRLLDPGALIETLASAHRARPSTTMPLPRPMSPTVRRVLRRRVPPTPDALACLLLLFAVALVAAMSSPLVPVVLCGGIVLAWWAVRTYRLRRATRLFRVGAVAHGRLTQARLQADGLELDYTVTLGGKPRAGTLVVTEALVVAALTDIADLLVFHDPRRPRVHLALLGREVFGSAERRDRPR